jgi:sugar-specific transcriptional regulator TrmB
MGEADNASIELIDFGLTALEARVYSCLNQGGIMSANQIAKVSAIARAEVYRLVKNLFEKGIVKEQLGRPRLYESIPPDKMMDILIGNYENKIRDLKIKQEKLSNYLLLRRNKGIKEIQTEQFELIKTLTRIIERIIGLTLFLENELLVINNETTVLVRAEMDELNLVTRKAANRGVKVKMITEVNENTLSYVKELLEYCDVMHSDHISFTLLVFDRRNMIIASSLLDEKSFSDKTDILTNSQEFVAIARTHFDILWRTSEDARTIITKLESND